MEKNELIKMRSKLEELNMKISSKLSMEKSNKFNKNENEYINKDLPLDTKESILLDNYLYKDPLFDQMDKHQSFVYSIGLELALEYSMNYFEDILKPNESERLNNRIDNFHLNIKNKREFFTKFNSNKKLIKKITKKFKLKQLECKICDFKTESKIVLDTHLAEPHNLNYLKCNYCEFKSRSKEIYTKHIYEDHSRICKLERPYPKHMCNICDYECNPNTYSNSESVEKLLQHIQITCPFRQSNLNDDNTTSKVNFATILANLQSPSRLDLLDHEYLFNKKPLDPYIEKYDLFLSKTSQTVASNMNNPNIPIWHYYNNCSTQEKVLLYLIQKRTEFSNQSPNVITLSKPIKAVNPIQLAPINETAKKLENNNIIIKLPTNQGNLTPINTVLTTQLLKPMQNNSNIKVICLTKSNQENGVNKVNNLNSNHVIGVNSGHVEELKKLNCELCSMKFIGGLQMSSFILHLKQFHKITNPTELNAFIQRSLLNNTATPIDLNNANDNSAIKAITIIPNILPVKRRINETEELTEDSENETVKRIKPIILKKTSPIKQFINKLSPTTPNTLDYSMQKSQLQILNSLNRENDNNTHKDKDEKYLSNNAELNYENERKLINDHLNKHFNLKNSLKLISNDINLPEKFNLNIDKLFEVKSISGKCYACNSENNKNLIQHMFEIHKMTPKNLATSNICIRCGLECIDKERFILHQFNAHGFITFLSLNKIYSINFGSNKYSKPQSYISNLDRPLELNKKVEIISNVSDQPKTSGNESNKSKNFNFNSVLSSNSSNEKNYKILSSQLRVEDSNKNEIYYKNHSIPLGKELQDSSKNKINNNKHEDVINLKVVSSTKNVDAQFKCAKCTETFTNKDKLLYHVRNEHLNSQSDMDVEIISKSNFDGKAFKVNVSVNEVKKSSKSVSEKESHEKVEMVEMKKAKTLDDEKKIQIKFKNETYKCNLCKKTIKGTKMDYQNHIKSNHLREFKIKLRVFDKKEIENILKPGNGNSQSSKRRLTRNTKKYEDFVF